MDRMDRKGKNMNLVFELEHVICSPNADYDLCKPIVNVTEFMHWLKKEDHYITIWTKRFNDLGTKLKTEGWLKMHQIPYDRLIFDRPRNAIFVDETPSNCKYLGYNDDVIVVAGLFEEWKEEITRKENDR